MLSINMRFVVLCVFVLGLLGVGIFLRYPHVFSSAAGRVPVLSGIIPENMVAKGSMGENDSGEEQKSPKALNSRKGDVSQDAEVAVNIKNMAGAWLAEDGRELLFLRQDGRCRSAMVLKIHGEHSGSLVANATITGIVTADWSLAKDSLIAKTIRFQEVNTGNYQVGQPSPAHATRIRQRSAEIRAAALRGIPKELRDIFELWGERRLGGKIERLSKESMELSGAGGKRNYHRVQPGTVRDPDGSMAESEPRDVNVRIRLAPG